MVLRASKVQKAAQPIAPPISASKKKRKKGKGKAVDNETNATTTTTRRDLGYGFTVEDIYFDNDRLSVSSAGEESGGGEGRSDSDLRAAMIHSMEKAKASTTLRHGEQPDWTQLTPGQTDLLETANDLYRSIDARGGLADDEEYWQSFPPHIRNFAQAMYGIAQQMMQTGVVDKNGTGGTPTAARGAQGHYPPSSFARSLPFDPAMFSDPEFSQSMEQAAAAFAAAQGRGPRVVEREEEEYDSEEDLFFNSANTTNATDTTSKKKNKRKKKKGVSGDGNPNGAVSNAPTPSPAEPESRAAPLTSSNPMPSARPTTTTTTAPPSSRAAGKQPMSYAPPSATSPPNQPRTTARAASKAPIPPHPYPPSHNHTHHPSPTSNNASVPHKPRPPATNPGGGQPNPSSVPQPKGNKIWSTSSVEERERIKEFWLGLGEEERRNLVKIEKDTVLKKMKEQQKHSCSCAVCGRKRNAIEEELEVLYDAYYEELEQYANYQQRYVSSGGTIPPPPGPGPFPGSVELDKNGAVVGHQKPPSAAAATPPFPRGKPPAVMTNGRKPPVNTTTTNTTKTESEFDDDDDGEEEEYDEEEEYEEEEDEEEEDDEDGDGDVEEEEDPKTQRGRRIGGTPAAAVAAAARGGRRPAPPNGTGPKANGRDGLFNLGNGLTVTGPGNILTVADDLLKNDGQKFLEMMEQLAERRMQREEEAAADVEEDSEDEEDDEGDEDDEDDEEDDEEDEDDDEEVMTEEQKMEEGKRMFSIFAARMFEQRVLNAYRERVAQERQLQLLRELEDEDKLTKEREAKKQSQNQKKKDKKRQQKLAKEEEKAQRAAEKAAEEAALKAKQAALEEEARKKREEERARREATRKAAEEEKLRKDAERRLRLAEEKEREAEKERKRKEREEKLRVERREREERERKARDEREAKLAAEKAAAAVAKKEQMEKEERERKAREEKAEKEARDRLAAIQQQQRAPAPKRTPTSPRNAAASGSSQRSSPGTNGAPKKILNKPPPVSPVPPPTAQAQRQPQQRPVVNTASQPQTPISPPVASHLPPSTAMYGQGSGIIPPQAMSPRGQPTPSYSFGPGPSLHQGPPSGLAPSALPPNFGLGPAFEPGFGRGLAPAAPIGPPSKSVQNPLGPPQSLAPGISRRASIPDPGPVARPIAPIARPGGDGTGSPSRRSPSPKGVLGSSALTADDDEVVPLPGRRVAPGAVGQGWGGPASPRTAIGESARAPWGAPGPGFVSPRPPSVGNMWGNTTPNPDWHPSSANFFASPFATHDPAPPHSG